MGSAARLGLFCLVLLLLLPTITIILYDNPLMTSGAMNYVDEGLIVVLHFGILAMLLNKNLHTPAWPLVYYFIFVLWNLFLILYNSLPLSHIFQVFITGQFFAVFTFFYYLKERNKVSFLHYIGKVLIFLFFLSLVFAFIQYLFPDVSRQLFNVRLDERGFGGIGLVSFFSSRVAFAEFLLIFLVYIVFLAPVYSKKSLKVNTAFVYISLAFVALIFTASRKEIVLGLLIIFAYINLSNTRFKPILILGFIIFLPLFVVVFINKFQEINEVALSDGYVRYKIFIHALEITKDYFPLGSGPGTYGSIMSVSYQDVYKAYNVPEAVLGHGAMERGPIFDMFHTSLIAEIGLGIGIIYTFFYAIYKKSLLRSGMDSRYRKVFLLTVMSLIFVLSIFTPILNNWIGFFLLSYLATSFSTSRCVN